MFESLGGRSMSTIVWEHVEHLRLMVLVHNDEAPTDAEWDTYAATLHALYAKQGIERILVFGDGPGPNARQRQKLHYKGATPVQTAVVTHSVIARGIVTALRWFFEIRAFAPAEMDEAFEYLRIPRLQWFTVRKCVGDLRMKVSGASLPTQFELTDTIGRLDEIVTDRLPKLRERMTRARTEQRAARTKSVPPGPRSS